MTINSVTAVLFTWHALKLIWQERISVHQLDSLLPESVGRSPTFWVSASSRGRLIGEEIRYLPPKKMLAEISDHFVTPGNIQMGEGYGKNSKLSGAC